MAAGMCFLFGQGLRNAMSMIEVRGAYKTFTAWQQGPHRPRPASSDALLGIRPGSHLRRNSHRPSRKLAIPAGGRSRSLRPKPD